jgi:hypothetical protein
MILSTLLPDVTSPEVKEGCIYVARVLLSAASKKEEERSKKKRKEQERLWFSVSLLDTPSLFLRVRHKNPHHLSFTSHHHLYPP